MQGRLFGEGHQQKTTLRTNEETVLPAQDAREDPRRHDCVSLLTAGIRSVYR